MTKLLLFSDLHVHPHKGSNERLQNCLDVLYWVLETARQRKIKDVIFAGDLFQDRQRISVFTYHQTFKILSQFTDLHLWMLLGNHDLWYYEKSDISSVIPIGALNHITVIDKPSTHKIGGLNIDFLPFTHDPITVIQENFQKKSKVLVGHVAVDGAILNFHYRTKSEVSVELENEMIAVNKEVFDGYKKVFLGHYHGQQKLGDAVEYIGSTLQLTFNEAFQKKHIIVFDTETFENEYIENTFSPKHLLLKPDELNDHELDGNFVRIYVDSISQADMINMRAKILEKSPDTQITFIHDQSETKPEDKEKVQKFNLAEGDTLERYVQTVGFGDLDQPTLLKLGKEICLEN